MKVSPKLRRTLSILLALLLLASGAVTAFAGGYTPPEATPGTGTPPVQNEYEYDWWSSFGCYYYFGHGQAVTQFNSNNGGTQVYKDKSSSYSYAINICTGAKAAWSYEGTYHNVTKDDGFKSHANSTGTGTYDDGTPYTWKSVTRSSSDGKYCQHYWMDDVLIYRSCFQY